MTSDDPSGLARTTSKQCQELYTLLFLGHRDIHPASVQLLPVHLALVSGHQSFDMRQSSSSTRGPFARTLSILSRRPLAAHALMFCTERSTIFSCSLRLSRRSRAS